MSRKITYCTNIHPGDSWSEVLSNLKHHGLAVKEALSPKEPFPLGLRVSALAASEYDSLFHKEFVEWCENYQCFPLTINGFPYGNFHGNALKAGVYDPDWRTLDRVQYTCKLADIFSMWHRDISLCQDKVVSISTVPVAFKQNFRDEDWIKVRRNIITVLEYVKSIYDREGLVIQIALEPEPCCVLETTDEVVDFFKAMQFPEHLLPFVGICLDCCHQAVEFEDPELVLEKLHMNDISIAKVQVSSALRASSPNEVFELFKFDEPHYLHQTVVKNKTQSLHRFIDLPELKKNLEEIEVEECRVHFHVPVFLNHLGNIGTTQFFIKKLLPLLAENIPLEIETYSFGVLPKEYKKERVHEAIIREITWVQEVVNAQNCST